MENRPVTPDETNKSKHISPKPASTDSEDSAANKKKMLLAKALAKAPPDETEQMLARDNLKIKTLAKYKTIEAGEIHMYQDIEN